MPISAFGAGLTPRFSSPPLDAFEAEVLITQEAGLKFERHGPRVIPLVTEGEVLGRGAPIACLHDAPDVRFVAPMPARVGRISLLPGHRLSEIVLFCEAGGDEESFDLASSDTEAGLRCLMQLAGAWIWLVRRPFGGMPALDERPEAIFVMATDTLPFAPDPREAIADREEAFSRGLTALTRLTDGPVFVIRQTGPQLADVRSAGGRVREIVCGPRHPQGSPGIRIHGLFPAGLGAPVWDIHAEDVALLGDLLATGRMSATRRVHVAGPALRSGRSVRTQLGADLRELTQRIVTPGAHIVLSGSPLDGQEARWLAPRSRQVTVSPRPSAEAAPHWLASALTRSARAKPIIPTAALTQSLGAELPATIFVRALTSGDDETAMKLGVLSLLEEDVALADYVLGGEADLARLLRAMLDRIQAEFAA